MEANTRDSAALVKAALLVVIVVGLREASSRSVDAVECTAAWCFSSHLRSEILGGDVSLHIQVSHLRVGVSTYFIILPLSSKNGRYHLVCRRSSTRLMALLPP